jgi:MEDS: MEthanogen/methylotroph, DcmR Sensory domain
MPHDAMIFEEGVAGLGWAGHLLLLHGSELEWRSRLAMWVRRGLERDEKVIFAQAETVAPHRSVLAVLAQQGIDVQAATARGQLLVLPLAAVYRSGPGGQVERIDRALAEGYRGVRLSGEASAALTIVPEHAYASLERSMDQLCRTYPVSTLCQYDRTTTAGAQLDQATATHGGGSGSRACIRLRPTVGWSWPGRSTGPTRWCCCPSCSRRPGRRR